MSSEKIKKFPIWFGRNNRKVEKGPAAHKWVQGEKKSMSTPTFILEQISLTFLSDMVRRWMFKYRKMVSNYYIIGAWWEITIYPCAHILACKSESSDWYDEKVKATWFNEAIQGWKVVKNGWSDLLIFIMADNWLETLKSEFGDIYQYYIDTYIMKIILPVSKLLDKLYARWFLMPF